MTPRTSLVLASVAGLAASAGAQEVMVVSLNWSEVVAGTTTPVLSPNSALEPGEGVYLRLGLFASINGSSAIGQTTTYTPPPPPGFGTIRGIASMILRLDGLSGGSGAVGSWSNRDINPILGVGSHAGDVMNSGATLDNIIGSQFPTPGQTADGTNPIANAFRGVWTPTSFANQPITFRVSPGTASPAGETLGLIVQYGTGYLDPSDPTTAYALYTATYVTPSFGNGITIPIIPSPATAWAAACTLAAAGRRRRQ